MSNRLYAAFVWTEIIFQIDKEVWIQYLVNWLTTNQLNRGLDNRFFDQKILYVRMDCREVSNDVALSRNTWLKF